MNEKFSSGNRPGSGHYILKYKYILLLSILVSISAAFFYRLSNPSFYTANAIIQSAQKAELLKTSSSDGVSGLSVSPWKDAGTLILNYKASGPKQARDFINRITRTPLNSQHDEKIIKRYNDSLGYITTELAAQNKKVSEIKKEITQIPEDKVITGTIPDKKQQYILKAILPYLKNAGQQYQLIPTSFPIKDAAVNTLILQFNNAQSAKQHLLSENPDKASIAIANTKIAALQGRLQTAIDNAEASSFKTKISMQAEISKSLLEDSLAAISITINKDVGAYAILNHNKLEYGQNMAKQGAQHNHLLSFKLTEHGINAAAIYFTAFLCGLFFPFGMIALVSKGRQIIRKQILKENTIESTDDAFVFNNADDTGLQQIAEKIKRLISERNKTILISSLNGAVDKNAICQALALYLSKNRTRVLIIDINFDNYRPGDSFKPVYPGLKDFIFNKVNKLEDIITSTPYPGISTISLGQDYLDVVSHYFGAQHIGRESIDKNQKKLIVNSPKLAFMTEKLSQKFDCILLNSTALDDPAGVLPLTDLTTLNFIAIENKADKKQQMGYLHQLVAKYRINDTYALLTDA